MAGLSIYIKWRCDIFTKNLRATKKLFGSIELLVYNYIYYN